MTIPGAIILGCEYQALGLLRQLSNRGIDCILIDQDRFGPALFSRYKRAYLQSPPYSNDEFWPWLKNQALTNGAKEWVLYTTDDEQVKQLAENLDEVSELFRYAGLRWESYKYLYDKRRSYEWTLGLGIENPRSFIPTTRSKASECELTYPFIIKPSVKTEFKKYSNKKAIKVRNKNELNEILNCKLKSVPVEEMIFQEIIPGGGNFQWSYAGFFVNGEPIAAFTANRVRQHPPDFGRASTYVEAIYDREVEASSLKILRKLKYTGLAEVEWKRDPRDNRLKFLEVNARTWGWHSIASRVVGNLPLYYYNYLLDGTHIHVEPQYGHRWVKWVTDIPVSIDLIINRNLSLKDWYRSVKNNVVSCDWDTNDKMPFFLQFLLLPYLISKRGY